MDTWYRAVALAIGLARGATIVLNPPDGLQAGQRVRAVPSTATSGG